MSERLVLPVALWGSKAPEHRISCVHMMHNEKNLVTGSHDGRICIWDVDQDPLLSIIPRCLITAHTGPVLCIADGDYITKNTIVTSSDSGEMCLWNIDDGQCLESKKTQYTHTFMQSFKVSADDCRLFCVGHYAEILVIDPKTFNIRFRLSSKDSPDWITSIHILQPPQLSNIVIIGLSITGIVRIWTITDETSKSLDPIYDNDRKALDCSKSVQIISNPESMRLILIVCPTLWQIYDATDFKQLCSVESVNNSHWTGGNFITRDQVLVWTDKGEAYLYQVATKQPSAAKLRAELTSKEDGRFLYPPKMCLTSNSSDKLIIRGDYSGTLTVWFLLSASSPPDQVVSIMPKLQQSLENVSTRAHITGKDVDLSNEKVVSSVDLPALSRVAHAREDGSIIIATTTQQINSRLNMDPNLDKANPNLKQSSQKILNGHSRRVNCLLYPNNTNPRYDEKYLLSGGADFAVCLWDVLNTCLLHKFGIHAGEITRFLIPPNECSVRLQTSICCIAADHSVSILNLDEQKCILMASRHLFPVSVIKWKPADDSMVVGLKDGSVYVWRLETGHLVKVLQGIPAEDMLNSCDESIAVYITTLAREIVKGSMLSKSKPEILRSIGIIIETMPLEVSNLIVETMDIILHCIDHSLLENRGLGEAFPAITRFYMVSYCSSSRRIAVGTVTGNLAMYELRAQSKPQFVPAHKSAVSACSFSPDGKYLASYSAGDNKLCFWLTATGLFGLGNARTRCVGAIDTPPVSADLIKSPSDLLRVARLIWVAGKVVILMFIDEREFRYQVAS